MSRILSLVTVLIVIVRSETEIEIVELPKPDVQAAKSQPMPPASYQEVRCYACTDCQSMWYDTTIKTCPYDHDYPNRNQCVSYVEKFKYLAKSWHVKGCASERGTCVDIRKAHEKTGSLLVLRSCNECKGDKCNGGSRSYSIAFLSLVVMPVLGKLALS